MSRLGIIVRADQRGIAHQSYEAARHLDPAKVLIVGMNDPAWPEDVARFRRWKSVYVESNPKTRELPETRVRGFLRDLDVVFAVETLYDWRMADWARDMGVRTVVQMNPEFYVHPRMPEFAEPDMIVWPTEWLVNELPSAPILPVPVPDHSPVKPADPHDGPLRVVHVAGHAAAGDRNGTLLFMEALASVRQEVEVTVVGQDHWLPEASPGRKVRLSLHPDGFPDRWDLYANQHLLISPRRYGGLSLVTNEACRVGLAVSMTDCTPNTRWPIFPLPTRKGRLHRAPYGPVPTFSTTPAAIARTIDRFAGNRDELERYMQMSTEWADANSWSSLRGRYNAVLS